MAETDYPPFALLALVDRARKESKWLICSQHPGHLTPDEVEARWGEVRWYDPETWTLKSPDEVIAVLREQVREARQELHDAEADLVRALRTLQAATPPTPEPPEPR